MITIKIKTMIQPNELRIGNWVKIVYDEFYHKVISIADFCVKVKCDTFYSIIRPSEIKTIPLTDELLEKCGFKYIGHKTFVHDLYFDIYKDKEGYYPYNFHEGVVFGCAIDSLHQLQNLFFALTGKELEIKL